MWSWLCFHYTHSLPMNRNHCFLSSLCGRIFPHFFSSEVNYCNKCEASFLQGSQWLGWVSAHALVLHIAYRLWSDVLREKNKSLPENHSWKACRLSQNARLMRQWNGKIKCFACKWIPHYFFKTAPKLQTLFVFLFHIILTESCWQMSSAHIHFSTSSPQNDCGPGRE